MLKSKSKVQVLQGSDSPKVHWNVKTITETETSKPNSKSDATKVTTEAESQTTPTTMMNQDQLENKQPEAETTKVVLEKQDMEHSEKEDDVESKPVADSTNATSENESNPNISTFLHNPTYIIFFMNMICICFM